MIPPRPTKTLDATVGADGTFDIDAYAVMDQRDTQLIQSELLYGAGSSKFVYSFSVSGKAVSGISVIGARHLAAHYGGIKHQLIGSIQKVGSMFTFTAYPQPGIPMAMQVQVLPDLRDEPDFYGAIVQVTDTKTGNVIQVEKREERYETKRDGTRYERAHYALIAQSKAYRNAVLDLLPQDVQIEWCAQMIKLGNAVTITESVIDAKRDAVLKFATARGLQINRLALDRLTMNQISGLGEAAREGALAFAKAAAMAGVMKSTESFISASSAPIEPEKAPEKPKSAETPAVKSTDITKPEPSQPSVQFHAYMADELGEMVMLDGQEAVWTDPVAFARMLHSLAKEAPTALQTLWENNEEAIETVRKIGGDAWNWIAEAFAALTAEPKASDVQHPVPIPTKGDRQDIMGYVALVRAALEPLTNAEGINRFVEVNHATIGALGTVGRRQVQGAIDDRRRALGLLPPETATTAAESSVAAEPETDRDVAWVQEAIQEIAGLESWQQVLTWSDGTIVRTKMTRLRAKRPDLFKAVDDAVLARKPQEGG